MKHSRSRHWAGAGADLWLLLQTVDGVEKAQRLARVAGWVLALAGAVVVALGLLMQHTPTMLEGTLVALLAVIGGWLRSRIAAMILMLLMALGLATGLAAGAATGGLLLQVALFGIALRMVEATFRFRQRHPFEQRHNGQ
ncbi:hypothetical protein TK90_2330 [Thioalkalivibrio sp. K90mix]|uniref:hypothetical protein n=1 Tax=unclassified Thioalkalivibrio TaxID=2621013 RepID=UPI00019598B1|nr:MULTISPECIES: hypothetical protein [unclassified Thioalkalivibrio]ADC72820.1 hypothetical protein TK90_2330 [Thioalkalivibrio sp. K90mix]